MTIRKDEFLLIAKESGILLPEYALDVLVRIAHHSSAIEGNTLSLSDTITILIDEMTPANSKKMREMYEVANHREGLATVLQAIIKNDKLSTLFVKEVHNKLLDHIRADKGEFKTQQNAILGSIEKLATPPQTPFLVEQWVENYAWQVENLNDDDFFIAVAQSHLSFETIHPFADGNGRVGRLLISYATLIKFGVPVVIMIEQRAEYLNFLQNKDVSGLSQMLKNSITFELERKRLFDN
ncbi:MAG: Fic family protein [Streptococcaceae bacterium]|nr:Fic family protein [Streptococcaceae bacterium]